MKIPSEKMKVNEFARMYKKEIKAWQEWLRKQSGKTIDEIDWASEPSCPTIDSAILSITLLD